MIWSAFVMGIIGSLHCVGMCGPLVLLHGHQHPVGKVLYHTGRSLMYGTLGLLAGFAGASARLFAMQQHLTLFAGALLLVFALLPGWLNKSNSAGMKYWNQLRKALGFNKPLKQLHPFTGGMLNGLLPCGMVYMALVGALAMPSIWLSAAFMVLFGIGTAPLLLGLSFGWQMMPKKIQFNLQSKLKYLTALIGILFIIRGMGLGIPYVSPQFSVNDDHQVESSCCTKEK